MTVVVLPLALALVAQVVAPSSELALPPPAVPLQPAPATAVPPEVVPGVPAAPSVPKATNAGESPGRSGLPAGPVKQAAPDSGVAAPSAALQPPMPTNAPPAIRNERSTAPAATDRSEEKTAQEEKTSEPALAERLWRTGLEQADASAFQGNPESLLDTIRAMRDTASQMAAIKAYWRLSAAIVQLTFAEEEATVLGKAAEPKSDYERAVLAAARAGALARQQEAQLAVTTAQFELLERAMKSAEGALPWPTDLPLVASYRTNFEALFAGRTAPPQLLRIHKTLPVMLQVLEGRAEAASAHNNAVRQVAVNYESGQVSLKELLTAVDGWREQRTAFVAGVLRYNEQITDYALSVVGPLADPSTIISTLINWKPRTQPSTASTTGVRPATAIEPIIPESPPAANFGVSPPATLMPAAPAEPKTLPNTQSVLKSIRVAH